MVSTAPVYLRINTLKTDRERALKALQPIGAEDVPGLNAARIILREAP